MAKTKQKAAYMRGKFLEERTYRLVKAWLVGQGLEETVWSNIRVNRPDHFAGMAAHAKAYREADIIFFYNRTLYIVECKYRRGVSKKGKDSNFWVSNQFFARELYHNGKLATEKYLSGLDKLKIYIKYHKIFKYCNPTAIQKVLLVDSRLEAKDHSIPYTSVRDSYIVTFDYLPVFLSTLKKESTIHKAAAEVPQEIRGCL